MIEKQHLDWTKENFRSLRLRMGWSKSDLAHRLHCSSEDVEAWELGRRGIDSTIRAELEFILRQADACSDEVQHTPAAENQCSKGALDQIDFSRVKANLE